MIRRTTAEKFNVDCIVQRTRQGSGSIYIWACMNFNGVGFVKVFEGRLNADAYIDILGEYLLPSIDLLRDPDMPMTFQQDNAPCHRAHIVRDWFTENDIPVMQWPPYSPDLSCIENLWSWLDKKLAKDPPTTKDELVAAVLKYLDEVPIEIIPNLVDSMPNRVNGCLKNNGGATRY